MENLIDQAQTIIKDHHLRWTKQRKMMIESVARHPDRYFNIVEIDQYLREQFPGLSHDTICGRVQEIQMPPIDKEFFEKQLPGVKITGHRFELHGICAQCQKKSLQ